MQGSLIYRTGRGKAVFSLSLGTILLCYAAVLPFLLQSPLLGFALMGIPMLFGAFVALMQGLSAAYAVIEITEDGLKMVLPGWRAMPVLPMRKTSVKWNQVQAVRRRVEVYTVFVPPVMVFAPIELEVYAIDTARERFIVPGGVVRRLPEAIEAISGRSGRPVQSEGRVSVKLFRSILRGAPTWQAPLPEGRR